MEIWLSAMTEISLRRDSKSARASLRDDSTRAITSLRNEVNSTQNSLRNEVNSTVASWLVKGLSFEEFEFMKAIYQTNRNLSIFIFYNLYIKI